MGGPDPSAELLARVRRGDEAAPPDEVARRVELLDRYDRALAELPAPDRELIVCRFELGMTYQEVAAATGRATGDAARMAVTRAFVRLAERLELLEAS
jgi:RNA polymerase sigma factor (sigma-70 family)